MALGEYFHVQLQPQSKAGRFGLEFACEFFRDFDVLKHHFQLLGKLEATFFLELKYQSSLSIFIVVAVFKKTLGKAVFVEALKDVFVEQVSEDVYDLVKEVVELQLLDGFEVLVEHFVKVEHKCLGSPVVLVYYFFKGQLDGKLNLGVSLHRLGRDLDNTVAQLDELTHKVFILDLLISDKFISFFNYEFRETFSQLFK